MDINNRNVDMDVMSETASEIVDYIVAHHTDWSLNELEVKQPNGDINYSERVQNVFNNVLDILDDKLN